MAILLQSLTVFIGAQYLTCFLTLAFGSFMFSIAIVENIFAELYLMNKSIQAKKMKTDILDRLIGIIALQANMKQLRIR